MQTSGSWKKKTHKFYINNNIANQGLGHSSNYIKQSKYNILTFLPKCLILQFMKVANIYFLIAAIIQSIKLISPLNPSTAIAPLVFVLLISLTREGIEDFSRHTYDSKMNGEPTVVYREGTWATVNTGSLLIGEIVLVQKNNVFPADLVVLDSSLDEGICYIETGSLDGEKNLKQKTANQGTLGIIKSGENELNSGFTLEGEVTCDAPNSNLYCFEGLAQLNDGRSLSYNTKHLLLKGHFFIQALN